MKPARLVCVVLVALVACGKGLGAGDRTSGIQGEVLIGPTCPVERVGSPCAPAPFAAKISVLRGTDVVATYATTGDGRFRIPLAPGRYAVQEEPVQPDGIAHQIPQQPVTVPSNGYVQVTIAFDSGLR